MPARMIGNGTVITPYLVKYDDKAIFGKDAFVKTVEKRLKVKHIS